MHGRTERDEQNILLGDLTFSHDLSHTADHSSKNFFRVLFSDIRGRGIERVSFIGIRHNFSIFLK
ncbi:hypothetical protein D1872_215300 [compost metagenome]